jgi:hypothetical protein
LKDTSVGARLARGVFAHSSSTLPTTKKTQRQNMERGFAPRAPVVSSQCRGGRNDRRGDLRGVFDFEVAHGVHGMLGVGRLCKLNERV